MHHIVPNRGQRIWYLHGIGSGADSNTSKTLRRLLPEAEIVSPELPIRPGEAYEFIKSNYFYEDFDMVIGTSLGGFYAQTIEEPKFVQKRRKMAHSEDMSTLEKRNA